MCKLRVYHTCSCSRPLPAQANFSLEYFHRATASVQVWACRCSRTGIVPSNSLGGSRKDSPAANKLLHPMADTLPSKTSFLPASPPPPHQQCRWPRPIRAQSHNKVSPVPQWAGCSIFKTCLKPSPLLIEESPVIIHNQGR